MPTSQSKLLPTVLTLSLTACAPSPRLQRLSPRFSNTISTVDDTSDAIADNVYTVSNTIVTVDNTSNAIASSYFTAAGVSDNVTSTIVRVGAVVGAETVGISGTVDGGTVSSVSATHINRRQQPNGVDDTCDGFDFVADNSDSHVRF